MKPLLRLEGFQLCDSCLVTVQAMTLTSSKWMSRWHSCMVTLMRQSTSEFPMGTPQLSKASFRPSAADPHFLIGVEGDPCFVFLHVDDLVIAGRNLAAFKAQIKAYFNMKDLGNINYVLGMKVTRDRSCWIINLSQELYIENMLINFGMGDCKPVSTPQFPSSRLTPTSTASASINYQRAVGLLNYLVSCTRPDIAYTASCLAQFLNNPSKEHEMVFKHVLQYLKGTKDWALSLGHSQDNSIITAYCDADWGSNFDS
ncbi:hypothetical protein O181_021881 [Austropuccinia psidii MF-1]|uniref:Reverse transcriptase Ty1/copia-type domain-containing protein n=1 Tax=Austropuccinia psidii MF-1 TaxID=1389203 RepID=A0A9Q3CGB6_9BASI|nr:hypothetical protein [Austropuccinia psidii MF-1]